MRVRAEKGLMRVMRGSLRVTAEKGLKDEGYG